ncbi:MAG TPA: peptide-methionine (S)-S-oxide reductase [Bacillus bacterium]|nr:peptide-methionine (S)-S-oxide reductase [Bacillus sp. (in: firmicutes)]
MEEALSLGRSELKMEKAVFAANGFFSQNAFVSGVRGIEDLQLSYLKEKALDVVEIWFNPWKVSYGELVELFFDLHDPTSKSEEHRQIGTNQSIIFFSNVNQLKIAKQKKIELNERFNGEITTKITPVGDCYAVLKS